MGTSAIAVQQEIILEAVRSTARGEWKVVVLDAGSKRLVNGVVKEDDILKENVTNIEQIEDRRPMNQEMDAVYILSPQPHIVDCLIADLERRRYRRSYIIWISLLSPEQRLRLDHSASAREQIVLLRVLNVDFYPLESHLITFRDPWSFPTLFHPACNQLVRKHMDGLAQKIVSICVSLGEYPTIRYHSPLNPAHEASVLCSHLARFVQLELDQYAKFHEDFPPPSPRPRGALIITDRSMDLFAPVVHEFTYQAMIHDLLPLVEGDKVYYKTALTQTETSGNVKDVEIGEKDSIWVKNRHLHMKDLLEKLASEFQAFKAKNPQFAESDNPSSLNNIKDMLAGLPQFQEGKEAFSLHLNMASDAMNVFQKRRLADIASVEQSLATGLDEDCKKPKNLADQVVRLLDDSDITFPDRLRLVIQYLLYRDGLLLSDTQKLLAHAQLPAQDGEVIHNLGLLGANVSRPIKDTRPVAQTLFGRKQAPQSSSKEESGLSRYEPAIKPMLEEHIRGTLDQSTFPFTKPHLDAAEGPLGQENVSQASLRSAKPTWARTRPSALEPRQRIIVFVAGGATYSESRACYEVSQLCNKDVFLATSHMLTPSLYLRQVGDLSVDKRRLDLPAERPMPQAPAHLSEREPPTAPLTYAKQQSTNFQQPQPPVASMGTMNFSSNHANANMSSNGAVKGHSLPPTSLIAVQPANSKLSKKEKEKDSEKKKKLHFFGSRK
ncbi:MAG: vacuolar sorting protein VPS33/slp1 [Alectoria sarmentosa]|nr:MAG: vacuolar sorting protein VPS33/slp1 [Alectoria sarmentosa]